MNNYKVYKHTTPSGKVYIGITCQEVNKRWKNGKGYDTCCAFARAIKKYGWKNIQHEILYENLSKNGACKIEKDLIAEYKSNIPDYGYNITSGGEHYSQGEEGIKKLSKSLKRYYEENPEASIKISERQIGKKCSDEHKKKTSEAIKKYVAEHPEARISRSKGKKGKHLSEEAKYNLKIVNQKKVKCVETETVYNSLTEVCAVFNIGKPALSQHLHKKSKSCGGYHFEFAT